MKFLKNLALSALGPVGSVLGTFMGSKQQSDNVRRSNQANFNLANLKYDKDMEMAEYSFDKNLEMWKRQNAYNSPEQQMKRFEDAGLNKHMIYGQGTPGNATVSPQYQAPQFQTPNYDERGTQNPLANSVSQLTAAAQNFLELASSRESLQQSEIKTAVDNINKEIAQDTQWFKTEQQKENYRVTYYQRLITNLDQTLRKYGLENADTTLRVLFRNMQRSGMDSAQGNMNPDYDEAFIRKVLSGITITKDLAKVLGAIGLGKLLTKPGKGSTTIRTRTGTGSISRTIPNN